MADLSFWFQPSIIAAGLAAISALLAAALGLAPQVGRLRRLERVVTILEKVENKEMRSHLISLRNRLILGLRPSWVWTLLLFLGGVAAIWVGVLLASTAPKLLGPLNVFDPTSSDQSLGFVIGTAGGFLVVVSAVRLFRYHV
jgi:hypothetical protein